MCRPVLKAQNFTLRRHEAAIYRYAFIIALCKSQEFDGFARLQIPESCCNLDSASRVSTDKLRLWSNANPMFTGGSDDEAVCIRRLRWHLVQARATRKERAFGAWLSMYNSSSSPASPLTPARSYQENLRAASVPARGGYQAVSIQDYARISSKRDEFLNFLLLPNPEGIPAVEYAGLRVA